MLSIVFVKNITLLVAAESKTHESDWSEATKSHLYMKKKKKNCSQLPSGKLKKECEV